jgi:hypothetical protein
LHISIGIFLQLQALQGRVDLDEEAAALLGVLIWGRNVSFKALLSNDVFSCLP